MGTEADDPLLGSDGSAEGNLDGPLPLRQAYDRLQRKSVEDIAAAEQRGLETGREQARRELAAEQLATSLGFNAQFGATYLRSNEGADVTEEAMRGFAESMGIPVGEKPPESETKTNEVPPEVTAAAASFSPAETGQQTPGELKTAQEWLELYQNPATRAEADRLAREGKVVIKHNIGPSSGTLDR